MASLSLFEKITEGTEGNPEALKQVKYIFAGSTRVCSVELSPNPSLLTTHYYHSDHLGSSNVVTDSSGQVASLTEFTPFGSISKQQGTFDPRHKFTGKELDSTGLYFYGARYYDPTIGRFITADSTIQHPYDPQDFNRYAYCRNNPINLIDPTGLGWGGFWKKIFRPFISAVAAVVAVWLVPSFAPLIAKYGFWAVAGTSAIAASGATATLDTEIGRRFVSGFSHGFFDNVLGMSPKVANFFGSLVSHALLASAYFMALSSFTMPADYKGPNYTETENQSGEFAEYAKETSGMIDLKGTNGGSSANYIKSTVENGTSSTAKFEYTQQGLVSSDIAFKGTPGLQQIFTALNIRHTATLVNINGKLWDSAANISLLSPSNGAFYAMPWTATCHQATFNTLMGGGMSAAGAFTTTLSHGTSSFVISTSLYGVNGGYGLSGILDAEVGRK